MKNNLCGILLFLSLFFWAQSSGETSNSQKVFYGLKSGLNFAFVPEILDEVKENHTKIRFNGGLFADIYLNDKFMLSPLIEYSLKGTDAVFILRNDTFTEGIEINADFSLDYISIPVIGRYKVYDNFYIGLGPYIAFMVKDKAHVYTSQATEDQYNASIDTEGTLEEIDERLSQLDHPLNATINRTDIGVYFDGGYRLNNGLGINMSYAQGLRNIVEGGEDLNVSPKNQVFFVGLDYILPTKKK